MEIIDLHCDVLLKLWKSKNCLNFRKSTELDVNMHRLIKGKVKVQCFAIFIPPELKVEQKFQIALEQINYFYSEVLGKNKQIKQVKAWHDLDYLNKDEIGAMLTLEGVDCIGNDLSKLSMLFDLGVKSVGLTWNNANLAADGIMEPRKAGLTSFGEALVKLNNAHKVCTDVSHLSEQAFWDVLEIADYPIASHSNAKTICKHPRNLTDQQAKALFKHKGMIHIAYYPPFVTDHTKANISDLLKHFDHFCTIGGVRNIGIGSDFDGITSHIIGLENASLHQNLINELLKYFSADQVKGFAGGNFLEHRPR